MTSIADVSARDLHAAVADAGAQSTCPGRHVLVARDLAGAVRSHVWGRDQRVEEDWADLPDHAGVQVGVDYSDATPDRSVRVWCEHSPCESDLGPGMTLTWELVVAWRGAAGCPDPTAGPDPVLVAGASR